MQGACQGAAAAAAAVWAGGQAGLQGHGPVRLQTARLLLTQQQLPGSSSTQACVGAASAGHPPAAVAGENRQVAVSCAGEHILP